MSAGSSTTAVSKARYTKSVAAGAGGILLLVVVLSLHMCGVCQVGGVPNA